MPPVRGKLKGVVRASLFRLGFKKPSPFQFLSEPRGDPRGSFFFRFSGPSQGKRGTAARAGPPGPLGVSDQNGSPHRVCVATTLRAAGQNCLGVRGECLAADQRGRGGGVLHENLKESSIHSFGLAIPQVVLPALSRTIKHSPLVRGSLGVARSRSGDPSNPKPPTVLGSRPERLSRRPPPPGILQARRERQSATVHWYRAGQPLSAPRPCPK
jgi:hypothetical protein